MSGRGKAVFEMRPGAAPPEPWPHAALHTASRTAPYAASAALHAAPHATPHAAPQAASAAPRPRILKDFAHCTDGELVTLALNGIGAAFRFLMSRQTPHLRRVIARRLRDPEDVLDAIQDTCIAVWRALQHYDAGRPFEAGATSIALNKCRDWARRRSAHVGLLARLQADGAGGGSCVEDRAIERVLIGEESVRSLERALESLPAQLRAPLLLTTVRERSQADAARELGLTRKAIEMRVRRARQQLARAMGIAS